MVGLDGDVICEWTNQRSMFVSSHKFLMFLLVESSFAVLKYLKLKFTQATLNESTLLTMSRASVNHLDQFLANTFTDATPEKKKEEKEKRMKAEIEYDRLFFVKNFGCETYSELINQLQ